MDKSRLKNGFAILKELNKLTLAFIENNCFLIPSKQYLHNLHHLHQELECAEHVENSDKRPSHDIIFEDFSGSNFTQDEKFENYNKFLLNCVINSKDLVKMVFKISDDFDFFFEEGQIVISGVDEFLMKYGKFISNKLTKINIRFEKDLKKAKKKRDQFMADSQKIFIAAARLEEVNRVIKLTNDIKKEQFVI